jgi:hypothetical protein
MNDINYIKFGIHLMKRFVSCSDDFEKVKEILDNNIFEIYVNILMNTEELTIIVTYFNLVRSAMDNN